MKSLVSQFPFFDTVDVCNFVINEFNPTFEVENMGNKAFQNASFGNASFTNEALSYSCLWAISFKGIGESKKEQGKGVLN